jgi:hypothetical protein
MLRRRTATPDGRWVVLWYAPGERRWYCDAEGLAGGPIVGARLRATVAAATGERVDAAWIEDWIERAVVGSMR